MNKRKAVYPGSFDPVTNGHLDLIERAMLLFDDVIVLVSVNTDKKTLFSVEDRVEFVKKAVRPFKKVKVDSWSGLTVDYAIKNNVRTIIRGLRATSDFDYEFQMALTNRKLSKRVDTVFLMPSENHFYLSSRLIKEIVGMGGNIDEYVPEFVARRLVKKLKF